MMNETTNKERQDEYPLYPKLSEAGQQEAQQLIDSFKTALKTAAEEVISNLYCDVIFYIESDSWANFRNELMDGLRNYANRRVQGEYDFKQIRQQIFEDFKDEIIKDLDQDNLEKIKELKVCLEECTKRYQEISDRYID